jgi:fumarate hydratase class II
MTEIRREAGSLGVVEGPADELWGAQTQRSLEISASARTRSRGI